MKVVTENSNYQRDTNSKALLLNDKGQVDDYKSRKKMLDDQKELRKDLDNVTSELIEIKELLKRIIDIGNNNSISN